MRRRFFVEGFEDKTAILHGELAHHLGRVLRAEPGQIYELSDGKAVWLARTEKVGRDEVEFLLLEPLPVPAEQVRIRLLLAVVKFDRFEWAIEKATELGVSEIVPLGADRSEKGLLAAAGKRAKRWERILTESAQQARLLRVPVLRECVKSTDAFRNNQTQLDPQIQLLLSERGGVSPMRGLLEPAAIDIGAGNVGRVTLAIGPEGGWTDAEFAAAQSAGFAEAALGINILRTETAVCAALAAVQYAFGAFRPGGEPGQNTNQEHEGKS
jgi:16S rRNA (uracil1498-N3)-methyltransferase